MWAAAYSHKPLRRRFKGLSFTSAAQLQLARALRQLAATTGIDGWTNLADSYGTMTTFIQDAASEPATHTIVALVAQQISGTAEILAQQSVGLAAAAQDRLN
jgi:hypothetical protein